MIDAKGVYYKDLNDQIRKAIKNGEKEISVRNVNGQRYIGAGLKGEEATIEVEGVPGNDLAAFMDGPKINVNTNAQDAVGNTMNSGKVIIHGDARDLIGHSMRGGSIYVKGGAGYRTGIHMKAYKDSLPVVIIGGSVRDFLGEYMAGGILAVLGMGKKKSEVVGNYVGTGMHGGEIYIRGSVEDHQLGKEVGSQDPSDEEFERFRTSLNDYKEALDIDVDFDIKEEFVRLVPKSNRPYGKIYTY